MQKSNLFWFMILGLVGIDLWLKFFLKRDVSPDLKRTLYFTWLWVGGALLLGIVLWALAGQRL